MKSNIFDKSFFERVGSPKYLEPYIGLEYISYSSLNSFLTRRDDWIRSYLLNVYEESTWTNFGKEVGRYFELEGNDPESKLSKKVKEFIDPHLYKGCEYEKPVGFPIEVGGKTILFIGFVDVYKEGEFLVDIKTGNDDAAKKYASKDYMQTRLYSHALKVLNGLEHSSTYVKFFKRKGKGDFKYPLYIENAKEISTPYNQDQVEEYIEDIIKDAYMEMEKYRTLYKDFE